MQNKQVVLITGASSGIGRALALKMAEKGYLVFLSGRNENALQEVQQLCKSKGTQAAYAIADVAKKDDCLNLIEQTKKTFGTLHILINNAGISMRALFQDCEVEVLEKVMNTNFWGTVYCTKYALPEIIKNKGQIIGISSIAGYRGLPARSGYSASKFAMNGFLESLRTELLYSGVNVMTVAPGFVASNIRNTALNSQGQAQAESPLDEKSIMQPEACADLILNAIQKRKKSLILTTQGKLTIFLNKWFPFWMDKKVFEHFANEPNSPLKK